MGVHSYLYCDKCKHQVWVGKYGPSSEDIEYNSLKIFYFLSHHYPGDYAELGEVTCKGKIKVGSDITMSAKQNAYGEYSEEFRY